MGEVTITYQYFPDPAEALALDWPAERILAECKRMPKEELTKDLRRRLLDRGLTPLQVIDLYRRPLAELNKVKQAAERRKQFKKENQKGRLEMAQTKADRLTPVECLEQGIDLSNSRTMTPEDLTREVADMLLHHGVSKRRIVALYGFRYESALYVKLERLGLQKRAGVRQKPVAVKPEPLKEQELEGTGSMNDTAGAPKTEQKDVRVEQILMILYPDQVPVTELAAALDIMRQIEGICIAAGRKPA